MSFRRISLLLLAVIATHAGHASMPDPVPSIRALELKGPAAGSIDSRGHGLEQPIFTDGVTQYAGYFDKDGFLVLASRPLGGDAWKTGRSEIHVDDPSAARPHIAVDGEGTLHAIWQTPNESPGYARGVAPHELEVRPMPWPADTAKDIVTNPRLIALTDGNLLLAYVERGADGSLLRLSRFLVDDEEWIEDAGPMVDGKHRLIVPGNIVVDRKGGLHIGWSWKSEADASVEAYREFAYAYSPDGGGSWEKADGTPLSLPITPETADVVARFPAAPENRIPSIAADDHGHPYMAGLWSASKDAPARIHFAVVDDGEWYVRSGPEGTSRPIVLVETPWGSHTLHLIYRKNADSIIAATATELANPGWRMHTLFQGASESRSIAVDPVQWRRLDHVHFLVPSGSSLASLMWSPNWARHQEKSRQTQAIEPTKGRLGVEAKSVRSLGTKVARWQWERLEGGSARYHPRGWEWAPFYIGTLEFAEVAPDAGLEQRMLAQAEKIGWQPHRRFYDADDHCVIQAYLDLYLEHREPEMIAASKARLDAILEEPSPSSLDWGSPNARHRWTWCDALFMGPMSWLMMWQATGDERYLDFMNKEWWATTERLYHPPAGLYFRDESYLDMREANGKTIHWSRGNGWVIAGLARILEIFPREHSDYPRYEKLFREMSAAFLRAQQGDGLWRPGLLDPESHPARETSGSSFITFGLAWGINHGLLDSAEYRPAVERAWNALADCVTEAGKLEHVQPIGAAPEGFDPGNSEPFAVGAFLLAAAEVYRLEEEKSHD